jgi:hypothetical protein
LITLYLLLCTITLQEPKPTNQPCPQQQQIMACLVLTTRFTPHVATYNPVTLCHAVLLCIGAVQELQRIDQLCLQQQQIFRKHLGRLLQAAQAAIAPLQDADMIVTTPENLLAWTDLGVKFGRSSSDGSGSGRDDGGSGSDGDGSGSDGGSGGWGSAGFLSFEQLFWFVADGAGLNDTLQQQQQDQKGAGGVQKSEEETRYSHRRHIENTWFELLGDVARLLPCATLDGGQYPVTADVDMSKAARMVYLAEVSSPGSERPLFPF